MFYLLIIYALIAVLNIPQLVKKKEWGELTAFLIFYVIAFVLGLLFVLDIPIPSPMQGLQTLITEVMGIKYPQ